MSRLTRGANMLSKQSRQIGEGFTLRGEKVRALGPRVNVLVIVLVTVSLQPVLGCENGRTPVTPSYSYHGLKSYGSYAGNLDESVDGSPVCPKTPPAGPYVLDAPRIYSTEGEYVGKFSRNRYDHESLSNPYGRYGHKYGSNSLLNAYGKHGQGSGERFYIVSKSGELEAVTRNQIIRALRLE